MVEAWRLKPVNARLTREQLTEVYHQVSHYRQQGWFTTIKKERYTFVAWPLPRYQADELAEKYRRMGFKARVIIKGRHPAVAVRRAR
jgi:hypothetical protein